MGFLLLLLGMVLFVATRVFKLAAPVARERMGNAAKGLVTAGSIAGIIIIIIGYRSATILPVWSPPSFLLHLNNVLMLLAFYTFGASAAKGAKVWLGTKVRHPQLTA
ncbi:MAG: putative membrane protein, partial [Paracoccaceae bacterium]